jgi:tRNA A-37 threonylcarbamoyl transferase component Bud32/Tfp pilus assembly protein PilF
MSLQRSRVGALTLLCALALASRADAIGAPAPDPTPVTAMTLEQAVERIAAAGIEPPSAPANPPHRAPVPSAAAIRAGSAAAALHEVASARASEAFARIEPWLPRFLVDGFEELQHGDLTPDALSAVAVVVVLLVLLGALARAARGSGTIAVTIDYPFGLRGTFCVKLAVRATAGARTAKLATPSDAERARHAAGKASATVRYGVSRETQFLAVPCRRHFIAVDGYLQTSESEDIVAAQFAEQEVSPSRGATVRVGFDFAPRACPVEVRVAWDRRTVEEARIARYGAPGSLRLARGPVQYTLDRGMHRILVGSTDRVAEASLAIETFEPRVLVIDLGERSQLVFAGCPQAVEPYLNGDIASAARALERDGQTQIANRLLARFHQERGQLESAARHYELAGERAAAAEIHQTLGQYEKAGRLFEAAGDNERAGEMFRTAGELLRAGEAYARADDHNSAIECFERAGDVTRWIEALSKHGRHLQAAQVALERGDRALGIQCLHRIALSDADYPAAVMHLADAYQKEGHLDLAVRKLEELLSTRPDADVPSEAIDRLARLCEQTRHFERALSLLDRLRARDATWPHVATRVEALRKALLAQTTSPDLTPGKPMAEGFDEGFRYEILEEIGRGGMGVVFRARDRRLGREVALKRLPDHIRNHPKAIELFLREARAAAALNHPNIVTLFDAAQERDTLYITMELLRGSPLQKVLREKGRLSPGTVAKIGGQIAQGLSYAHEQGIVHRDIKTANIFFTDKKVVKIMDFGLAKMVEEVRRSTTVVGGTPYYMAPEQSAGEQVDHRADLYALGVTFFELLTGSVPFKDGDVAFHHRHTPPPPVRDVAPGTPEPLAALVEQLLAKRPSQRVRSAGDVVRRLAEIARSAAS